MDEETSARLAALQAEENEAWAALADVYVDNKDLVERDQHPDQGSPSYNEKVAMRDRVVGAERALQDVQEQIRAIEWTDAGIDEGDPLTIGIDNVAHPEE